MDSKLVSPPMVGPRRRGEPVAPGSADRRTGGQQQPDVDQRGHEHGAEGRPGSGAPSLGIPADGQHEDGGAQAENAYR